MNLTANLGVDPSSSSSSSSSSNSASSDASSGNQQLQQAFNTALAEAQNTLIISTYGNADLNALRARPQ